jgi:acyl carrier protein
VQIDRRAIFDQVVTLLRPYAKDKAALGSVADKTLILGGLRINSARLTEIVVQLQDVYGIRVSDDDADTVRTVGNMVDLVMRLRAEA